MRTVTKRALLAAWLVLAGCHRTGTSPDDRKQGRAMHAATTSVWIDTDPSIAPGGHEVDDGFALVQAFHSPELQIRGVSVVFGNAELEVTWPIGRDLVRTFGPEGVVAFRGAKGPEQLGVATEASEALAAALARERLTIIALGPVTNVATVLNRQPALAARIDRIIAVAGRRHDQHFVTGTTGHRPFRDLNFELDPRAFQVLLDTEVPIVLVPWEISSTVWITRPDLDRLGTASPAARWLVGPATEWLGLWREKFGVDGFNPFDALAVGFVTSPHLIEWEDLPAAIEEDVDDTGDAGAPDSPTKPYLLVSSTIRTGRTVRYCFRASPAFKGDLLARLAIAPTRSEETR